jgi:hypothetical protein
MPNVIKTTKEVDWSGLKFLVAEEMGECMDAIYAQYDHESQDLDFHLINHKYHDGVGGFTRLLVEKEGYDFQRMPVMQKVEKVSWFKKLGLLWRYIKLTQKCDTQWKNRIDTTGKAEGVVFAFLTREQTKQLKDQAIQSEGTMNSLLCWALDSAAQEFFLVPGSERKWVCPVNMRGAVGKEMDYGNVAASIIMNFKDEETPASIRSHFREYFKNQIHFGAWLYTNMARFVGLKGTRKVAKKIKDVGVGVFSNMGAWPQETYHKTSQTKDNQDFKAWAVAPPASQVLPVGCAALEWEGRLSLALQLHPCLQVSLDQSNDFMLYTLKLVLGETEANQVAKKAVARADLMSRAQRLA